MKYDVMDEVRRVFELFDKDGDGFISGDEVRDLMDKLGESLSERQVREMVEAADADGDGRVSYEEFVAMLTR